MKKVIPAWWLTLLIIIGLAAILMTIYVMQMSSIQYQSLYTSDTTIRYPKETTQEVNEQSTPVSLTTYTDQTLGISFMYPTTWGAISRDQEEGYFDPQATPTLVNGQVQYDGVIHYSLFLPELGPSTFQPGPQFLSAYRTGDIPGRDGYWGDRANLFTSQAAVEEWCNTHDTCELFTNAQGVLVAHAFTKEVSVFDDIKHNVDEYAIFHSGHTFYGIILSDENLSEVTKVEITDTDLREVVNSIRFTAVQE